MRGRMYLYMFIVGSLLLLALTSVYASVYNTTNLTSARNVYEQTKALNDIVGGYIGVGIILSVFVITFVIISGNFNDVIAGLGAGSFIALLSSTLLLPLELIGFNIWRYTAVIFGVGIFMSYISQRR